MNKRIQIIYLRQVLNINKHHFSGSSYSTWKKTARVCINLTAHDCLDMGWKDGQAKTTARQEIIIRSKQLFNLKSIYSKIVWSKGRVNTFFFSIAAPLTKTPFKTNHAFCLHIVSCMTSYMKKWIMYIQ